MLFRLFVFASLLLSCQAVLAQRGGTPGTLNDPSEDNKLGRKPRTGKGSIFLNDSTRQVYGPKTTLYTSEEDIFYNRKNYRIIDTTILNLHRWGYLQRFNYLYQDLGNIGTALNPIYPVVRNFAGAVSGFNTYRLYYDTEEPLYYDTKSPYAKIKIIWGGAGRSMTDIEFTRNINPRWNFGFTYRPILVDKQLERRRRGDRQVVAHYYDFHTSFKTKDERYKVLFNFRRTRHRVFENGGVRLEATDTFDEYFSKEASPRLVAAETQQFLRNYHLYNQYSLANALQIYETLDLSREANYFFNTFSSETADPVNPLFDNWEKIKTDTLKANDLVRFSTFTSESGLKGRAGFLFYNVYYKLRTYSLHHRYDTLGISRKASENFLGARLSFDIDSLTRLSGVAEINQLGNYSIDAKFTSKLVDASFVQSIAKPGFLYNQYWGVHDFWKNDFQNITGLKLEGFLKTPFKKYFLAPGLSYTLLNNYVYFRKGNYNQDQTVLPQQATSTINVVNPQVKWGIYLTKGIKFSGSVINNQILSDADGALSIPDWLATGQLSLEDYWFKNNLQVHFGVDVTWRSAYNAMGYDIPTAQYYIQSDVMVGNALIVDPFLNAKMKRGRLWVKYHNLMQLIQKTGYLVTPGYPAQRNIIDWGFELILFD